MKVAGNIFVLVLLGLPLMAATPPAFMPVQPQQLLQAAPTVPPEWKKITSRARTVISAEGDVVCMATQVYQILVPVKGALPDTPPQKIDITLTFADRGHNFPPAPPSSGSSGETLTLNGYPATVIPSGKDSMIVLGIPPRLALRVTIDGMAKDEAKELFQKIDPAPLYKVAQELPTTRYPTMSYTLSTYDEMNPSRNRSYQQAITPVPAHN